jgi:ParB family chromosome partitioning protein
MRGLESLIPQKKDTEKDDKVSPMESVFMIEVEKIHPNPFQPRKDFNEDDLNDLAASIKQFGVLQPLIVSKVEKDTPTGRDVEYELIAGERRLRASQIANLPRVPVVVRRSTSPEKLAISVIENIQREDLSPVEEARSYERLSKQFGMKYPEIAKQVSKSRSVISNAVRMLRLPEDMIKAVEDRKIHMANSRYLLMLESKPENQRKLFDEMIAHNLDVDTISKRVKVLQDSDGRSNVHTVSAQSDTELDELAEKMKDAIGINDVKLARTGRRTRLVVEFPTKKQMVEWVKKKILTS